MKRPFSRSSKAVLATNAIERRPYEKNERGRNEEEREHSGQCANHVSFRLQINYVNYIEASEINLILN